MKHKGTTTLTSSRLVLRPFELNDEEAIFKNTEYLTWLSNNSNDITKDLLKTWVLNYDKNDNYNWGVVFKETNELIGSITVVNIDNNNCEIKFGFAKDYWNKGIATQSMQMVLDYLFNEVEFDSITACFDEKNLATTAVLEKLNMRAIGETADIRKNNKGEVTPFSSHSITKQEFNSINIRKAYLYEVDLVGDIYDGIVTHLENTTNFCGWKHGIYPTLDVAKTAYSKGELFVAIQSGKVIGSCVLNHIQAKQYLGIDWEIDDVKPLVVHTVAINPNNLRQGVAHKLLEFAKIYAKENDILTIRLDASEPNIPARKIYEDVGFIKRGEMDLETNRGGINNWFGYEFIIKKEK